jgi:RND superfamily putative drug exporter
MKTSRAALDRLLAPGNASVTLQTLTRAWTSQQIVEAFAHQDAVAFAIVFGLSMDYEVFWSPASSKRGGAGSVKWMQSPEGLARTAGLITSAAAIMIVVFAAFTIGNFLMVKMIGFTLAIAVFIDATLVRIVIGPALLRIAGDWNWWPGGSS